jgi:hypothetical protein
MMATMRLLVWLWSWPQPLRRVCLGINFLAVGAYAEALATHTADWTTWAGLAFSGPVLLLWLAGGYRDWERGAA